MIWDMLIMLFKSMAIAGANTVSAFGSYQPATPEALIKED